MHNMFGLILFIISALIAIGGLGYLLYLTISLVKSPMLEVDFKKIFKKYSLFAGIFVIGLTLLFIAIPLWNGWTLNGLEWVCVILGGLFTSVSGIISLETFIIHYYGKNIPEKLNKVLFIILMVTFPLLFVFIFILTDGYALHFSYPLINGISFTGVIPTPETGGANITFYALCILTGAIYAYLISDHKFYLQYGKHGILESTFIIAFPAGIIGARIFYVIGNWHEFAPNPVSMFYIWQGGLTILGGAIVGIVAGVAWFMWRNKGYNIWLAVDIIVPTILLAQAVGRWGNFFNCEVHGVLSNENYWRWLPLTVFENAHYSSTSGWAPEGQLYVPLFFIESLVNLLGFFVLSHLFGNALRKYTELGDIAFGYLIWYGLTRTIMEPLRDSAYNMGNNGYWSWFWSIIFVLAGTLLIVINHTVHRIKKKKEGTYAIKNYSFLSSLIESICFLLVGSGLLITGAILMHNSTFTLEISFNNFNIGLILAVLGGCLLIALAVTIPTFIDALIDRKNPQNA